jgi:hypothetical protein
LLDVIEDSIPHRKKDRIDYIISEGLLDDEIDDIIKQEIADKNPAVKHLWADPNEPEVVAFQDCEHAEGFDLLDVCRICARTKAECQQ